MLFKKNKTPYIQLNVRDDGIFFVKVYWVIGLKNKEYHDQIKNLAHLAKAIGQTKEFLPFIESGIRCYGHDNDDYDTAKRIISMIYNKNKSTPTFRAP